jgi:perosamine synthetase
MTESEIRQLLAPCEENPSFIPLSVPVLQGNEWKYVKECIDTGWVSSAGSFVTRFENEMAEKLGAVHAVACVNGTAALHTAMIMSGVQNDDEVLVPTLTFIAAPNSVRYVGAHPVFMDCDEYLNLDPEKVGDFLAKECCHSSQGLRNGKTGRLVKAIVAVHVFGHPANLRPIRALADQYRIPLIEDATESLGSYFVDWNGEERAAGTIGNLACLSFNGNKLLTTGGGGMILTQDSEAASKARYLTTQAKDTANYVHHEIGYNYRLTNVAAALGVAQLERLDEYVQLKRLHHQYYQEALKGLKTLRLLEEPSYARSNYWLNAVILASRERSTLDALMEHLQGRGIEARPVWALCHTQRPYQECQAYHLEKAPDFESRILTLPSSVNLNIESLERVVSGIKEFYGVH